jgi:hypothetical protein
METFILLFATCIVGGLIFTGFLWLIFWLTGIFQVPSDARRILEFLHLVQKGHRQEAIPNAVDSPLHALLVAQAGMSGLSRAIALDYEMTSNSQNETEDPLPEYLSSNTAPIREIAGNLHAARY